MPSWLAFLLTLSLIILVHEWGHFIVARMLGVKVERFSFGFGPQLVKVVHRETEYCVCLLPFGGYVKLAGEVEEGTPSVVKRWEYRSRPVHERFAIVFAGPAINYLLGFLLFVTVFLVGSPVFTSQIGTVIKEYPAAEAGLRPGDRVLQVNGEEVQDWEAMTKLIRAQTELVTLTIERKGRQFNQVLTPKVSEHTNFFGQTIRVAMVGITPSDEVMTLRYPLGEAMAKSLYRIWFLTRVTLQSLWRIATGGLSFKESMTGPIGIFYITSAVAQQGFVSLLQLVAILSTSIGLFNLLPIPVLDGGHLAFLTVEKIRGKAVSLKTQEAFVKVGLGLLLLLLLAVTYNDLVRFNIAERILQFFGRS